MIQLLFVNELRDVNTRIQECRSHSTRIAHQRKRQQKAKFMNQSQRLDIHGLHTTNRKIQSPSLLMQPAFPLMLGPNAAPAAELGGHECISYYVSRARSTCTYVMSAFKMSGIRSLDWAEYMANNLLYHAGAAFAYSLIEGSLVPSKKVLKHRGRAIEVVRRHLLAVGEDGQKVDPHAIAAVTMLARLDEMMGDMESYELHRKMIGILMNYRGDVSREYDPTYFFVGSSEVTWSCQTGHSVFEYQPTIRHRTKLTDQHSFNKQSRLAALPVGFRALLTAGELSVETAETVLTMQDALTRKPEYHPQQDPSRQDWFQVFPYLHPDHPDDLTFEELVELALLLFCTYILVPCDLGLGTTYAARKKLAESLPIYLSQRLSMSKAEVRTLLWIELLTLYAWQRAPQDPHFDETSWLLLDLPLELLATLDGNEVQGLMKEYLWTEAFLVFGRDRWESFNSEKDQEE